MDRLADDHQEDGDAEDEDNEDGRTIGFKGGNIGKN